MSPARTTTRLFATSWLSGRLAILVLTAGLISDGAPVLALGERWKELPPPPLAGGAAVYDPVRGRSLLVGGSEYRPTVWSVTGSNPPVWSELRTQGTTPTIPANAVIYDPLRDRLVMFVGGTFPTTWALRFDTDPPAWEALVTAGTSPATLRQYSAIYDPVRDRMLVFGGWLGGTGFPIYTNDVWALSFSPSPTWSLLSPTGTRPIARYEHTAIYDPTGDRMIVFGGAQKTGLDPTLLNESWSLSLSGTPAWRFLTPTGSPPLARLRHSAVLDPVGQRMIVFGGTDRFGNTDLSDVWSLSLTAGNVATWTQLPSQPPGRSTHVAWYHPASPRMQLYGGYSTSGSNKIRRSDLWGLNLSGTPTWALESPFEAPPPLWAAHTGVLDANRSRAYVFGQEDQTWARSLATDSGWGQVPGSLPGVRYWSVAASDPIGDRALTFGGRSGATYLDDTRALNYGTGTWLTLTPNPEPPSRDEAFAAFDPSRRRMLLYGGLSFDGRPLFRDDTWSFDAANDTWTELAAGTLGGRYRVIGICDLARDRLVVFGGGDSIGLYNDVHVLPLGGAGTWIPLVTQGTPPSIQVGERGEAIYDPVGDRMIVLGPLGDYSPDGMGAWALSLSDPPTWSQIAATGRQPTARHDFVMVADYARGRAVFFGGSSASGGPEGGANNETWAFYFTEHPLSVPSPTGSSLRLAITPNPGAGPFVASFALERRAPTTLEVFDLQGRRVAVRHWDALEPGRHSVRLEETRRLAPGLYFVQLSYERQRANSRAVVIR